MIRERPSIERTERPKALDHPSRTKFTEIFQVIQGLTIAVGKKPSQSLSTPFP